MQSQISDSWHKSEIFLLGTWALRIGALLFLPLNRTHSCWLYQSIYSFSEDIFEEIYLILFRIQIMFIFFYNYLLRYINETNSKCTVWWILTCVYTHTTITQIKILNTFTIFSPSPISHLSPYGNHQYVSVFMSLQFYLSICFLDFTYKRNHMYLSFSELFHFS